MNDAKTIGRAAYEAGPSWLLGLAPWEDKSPKFQHEVELVARAAVTCFLAKLEQAGYKIVPREPTKEMYWPETARAADWQMMYDAAPAFDLDAILGSDSVREALAQARKNVQPIIDREREGEPK